MLRFTAVLLMIASSPLATGADSPPEEKSSPTLDCLLPARLTPKAIEAKEGGTFTKIEFAGVTYWVLDIDLGDSVPRKQIGIYAPDKDGVFHLSLSAKSWAAAHIEARVDQKTGILELRGKLKGQLVLSCNLRTVGTQHSTEEK